MKLAILCIILVLCLTEIIQVSSRTKRPHCKDVLKNRKGDWKVQREIECLVRELEKLKKKIKELKRDRTWCGSCDHECPDGFIQHYRRCYNFVLRPRLRWEEAKAYCAARGSNLVTVNTTRKLTFLKEYLDMNLDHNETETFTSGYYGTVYGQPYHWNPGKESQSAKDRAWYWANGQSVVRKGHFLNWPEGNEHENKELTNISSCLVLRRSQNWQWAASKCPQQKPFICEIKLPRPREKTARTKNRRRGNS